MDKTCTDCSKPIKAGTKCSACYARGRRADTSKGTCSVCSRPQIYAKSLCPACYTQQRRDPEGKSTARRLVIEGPVSEEEKKATRKATEKRYSDKTRKVPPSGSKPCVVCGDIFQPRPNLGEKQLFCGEACGRSLEGRRIERSKESPDTKADRHKRWYLNLKHNRPEAYRAMLDKDKARRRSKFFNDLLVTQGGKCACYLWI